MTFIKSRLLAVLSILYFHLSICSLSHASQDFYSNHQNYVFPVKHNSLNSLCVDADLLCFYAFENGLNQIISPRAFLNQDPNFAVSTIVNRARETSCFQWRPGIRLAITYPFEDVELKASYTYFYTQLISNHSETNKFNSKLNINILDFTAEKNISMQCPYTLKPYLGLRTALFYQKVKENFTLPNPATIIGMNIKERYCAFGPLIGLKSSLPIRNNFQLFVNVDGGILFAHFNDIYHELNGITFLKSRQRHRLEQIVMDISCGISWQKKIGSINLIMQLALEHHRYFDHNQIDDPGDLSINGLSFSNKIIF